MGMTDGHDITQRDMYGTPFELLLWGGMVIGSPVLMLYGLTRYPPLVTNPTRLLFVALGVFVIAAALVIVFRRKLMPWGEKLPIVQWLGVLSLPCVPAMAGVGVFLMANSTLDHSRSAEVGTVIDRIEHGNGVTLRSTDDHVTDISFDISQADHDNVEPGDSVQLRVKAGALGLPWITGYSLRRIPTVAP
jgi:hypothetical protein